MNPTLPARFRRIAFRLLLGVIAIVVLAGLALWILVGAVDWDAYRDDLAGRLSSLLGREVRLEGRLRLKPGTVPRLVADKVIVGGEGDDQRIRIERLGLALDLPALAKQQLAFRSIEIDGARAIVHTRVANADPARARPDAAAEERESGGGSAIQFRIEHVRFRDLRVLDRDDRCGSEAWWEIEELALDAVSGEHAALHLKIHGTREGVAFRASGRLDPIDRLIDSTESWRLDLAGEAAGLRFEAVGGLERQREPHGFHLALHGHGPELAAVSSALPAVGPVMLSGRIQEGGDGFVLDGLTVEIGDRDGPWTRASGRIGRLHCGASELELHGQVRVPTPTALSSRLPPALDEIGPAEGRFVIQEDRGRFHLEISEFEIGNRERVQLYASGRIVDLATLEGIEGRVHLRAEDRDLLGRIVDVSLPVRPPVEIEAEFQSSEGRLRVEGARGRLGQTRFTGKLAVWRKAGGRPVLELRIASPRLQLADLGVGPVDSPPSAPHDPPDSSSEISADRPLDFDVLQTFDGSLGVRANEVVGGDLRLSRLELELRLRDGELQLAPSTSSWEGGHLELSGRIDSRPIRPDASLAAELRGAELGRVLALFLTEPPASGRTDISTRLTSRGRTLRELGANLEGTFHAWLEEGTVDPRFTLRTERVMRAMVAQDWKPEPVPVRCFALNLAAAQGLIRIQRFVLDTPDILLRVRGHLDFPRETLKLALRPKPNLLGVTAVPLNLEGSLREPTLAPITPDMLTQAGEDLRDDAVRYGRRLGAWLGVGQSEETLCSALRRSWRVPPVDAR
jgi:uncharacterized protein involved in outer membrane biogenesis